MIVHVVLLKPKPEVTDEQRQAIVATLRQAATTIPSVRRLRVGKRVRHGRPPSRHYPEWVEAFARMASEGQRVRL